MNAACASIAVVLVMVLAGPAAHAQTAASASAAASAAAQSSSVMPDLESRLEAAQRRLEAAANEVAELSAERGQAVMRRYSFVTGRERAIIGVQLDDTAAGEGARVLDVSPGGPAAEAGIRAGDVITAVNGKDVKGGDAARQVERIVRELKPESKVRIKVSRNGEAEEFTVTTRRGTAFAFFGAGPGGLAGTPVPPPMAAFSAPPALSAPPARPAAPLFQFGPGSMPLLLAGGPLAQMELATLTPRLGRYFGTDKGVLVVRAPADGALKLEDGDVILSIDGRVPESGPHATRILASYQPGEKLDLRIMRDRKPMNIETSRPQDRRRGSPVFFRSGELGVPRTPGRVLILRGGAAT